MGIRLTSRRRVLAGYAIWMALLVAAHYAFAGLRTETAALIGVSAVAAMLAGVALQPPGPADAVAAARRREPRRRPRRARPAPRDHGEPPCRPLPLVRRCHLPGGLPALRRRARAVHPVAVHRAGPAQRGRRADPPGRPRCCSPGSFFVIPDAANPSLTWLQRFASVAYPVGNLLILVTLARLLAPGTAARHVHRAAHLRHGRPPRVRRRLRRGRVFREYRNGALLDARLAGLLHRLGGRRAAPVDGRADQAHQAAGPRTPSRASDGRADARVADPADLLFAHSYVQPDEVEGVIAVACGVLYLLMLTRLWDVAASHRRGLIRERTLRVASAALASAGSVEEVATAVTDAAAALTAAQPANRTALLAVQGRRLPAPRAPGGIAPSPPTRQTRWTSGCGSPKGGTPRFVSTRRDQVRQARHRAVRARGGRRAASEALRGRAALPAHPQGPARR